jgi:uncharacterized SAM-binding protein YcdF (DUF218 family)
MISNLWVKALLKSLVLPPTGLLIVVAIGLVLAARKSRIGLKVAAVALGLLLLISVPVVADFLIGFVDTATTVDLAAAQRAQAIVILGGGVRYDAPEYGGDTLGILSLERVRYGARLARMTKLPVLVSGGSVLHGMPEAYLMRSALEGEFGVPVRWMETQSRTTHENALRSAETLRAAGINQIVLVAHAFDMRRAIAEFRAQGLVVTPAPTGQSGASDTVEFLDYVPSMAGLQRSYYATYEILANLVLLAGGNR